jgi:2,4-dienoyl-CoA reductase-like NADH-dependent reductase (Old Yellow Enzyme family)
MTKPQSSKHGSQIAHLQGQKRKNKPWDQIPYDERPDEFEGDRKRPDLAERELRAHKTRRRKGYAHKEVDPRKATKADLEECAKDYRADAEKYENHLTRTS